MGIIIYLFYLLLEVIMLIRITNLNYQTEIFNHLRRLEICFPTVKLHRLDRLGIKMENEEVRGVYRLTSLYSNVIWNNVRMIRMRTK
jgi:hypothetical protein